MSKALRLISFTFSAIIENMDAFIFAPIENQNIPVLIEHAGKYCITVNWDDVTHESGQEDKKRVFCQQEELHRFLLEMVVYDNLLNEYDSKTLYNSVIKNKEFFSKNNNFLWAYNNDKTIKKSTWELRSLEVTYIDEKGLENKTNFTDENTQAMRKYADTFDDLDLKSIDTHETLFKVIDKLNTDLLIEAEKRELEKKIVVNIKVNHIGKDNTVEKIAKPSKI